MNEENETAIKSTGLLRVHIDHPFQAARQSGLIKRLTNSGEPGIQVFPVVAQNHQLPPVPVGTAGDHCGQRSPYFHPVAAGERLDPIQNLQTFFHGVGLRAEYGHGANWGQGTGFTFFKKLVGNGQVVAAGQGLQ